MAIKQDLNKIAIDQLIKKGENVPQPKAGKDFVSPSAEQMRSGIKTAVDLPGQLTLGMPTSQAATNIKNLAVHPKEEVARRDAEWKKESEGLIAQGKDPVFERAKNMVAAGIIGPTGKISGKVPAKVLKNDADLIKTSVNFLKHPTYKEGQLRKIAENTVDMYKKKPIDKNWLQIQEAAVKKSKTEKELIGMVDQVKKEKFQNKPINNETKTIAMLKKELADMNFKLRPDDKSTASQLQSLIDSQKRNASKSDMIRKMIKQDAKGNREQEALRATGEYL